MAVISGTAGNDTRVGTRFNDTISTGNGNDIVFAVQGNDTVFGGNGNDTAFGGDGRDWLYGAAGRDSLVGDADGDRLDGGEGNDNMNGGTGGDTLWGGNGADWLWGGDDNDSVLGGNGVDLVGGGSGDDLLTGGLGNDSLRGLDGTDTAVFSGDRDGYSVVRTAGVVTVTDLDTTNGNDGTDRLTDVERLRFADRTVVLDGPDPDAWFSGFPLTGTGGTGLLLNEGGAQGGIAGEFAAGPFLANAAANFADAALGDLDGDGDLDVALAIRDADGNTEDTVGSGWLRNQGGAEEGEQGTFAEGAIFGNNTDAFAVALGDLDNDGDLDIVLTGGFDDANAPNLAINQGGRQEGTEGNFVVDTIADLDAGAGFDVALGDIDGDGDLDIVTATYLGGLAWAENLTVDGNAPETLGFATKALALGTISLTVSLGDLDGDGTLDAVISGNFTDALEQQSGAAVVFDFGVDEEPDVVPIAGMPYLFDSAIGDLDGDGDLDILGTTLGTGGGAGALYLAINQGGSQGGNEGDFVASGIVIEGIQPVGLALGDLDGDGDLDFLAATDAGVVTFLNQGGLQGGSEGDFAAAGEPLGSEAGLAIRLALGDVDGDGNGRLTESGLPWLGDGLAYTNELGLV